MRRVPGWIVAWVLMGLLGACSARVEAQGVVRKGFDESTAPMRIERPVPLKGVDLVAEFGAELGYLEGLGWTVDAARQFGDPAALAVAARTLHRAEAATGRTSRAVTSSGLLAEAERMVTEYEDATSVPVVADVLRELAPDGAARASALEARVKAWQASPPVRREGTCTLIIRNPTRHRVDIWVNNRYLATMGPYDTRKTLVPRGVLRLCAVGRLDPWRWGPVERQADQQFIWLLEKP